MSSQPLMRGHLAIPRYDILFTIEPLMCSNLPQKATFPVLQGWLLIAVSTVFLSLISFLQLKTYGYFFLHRMKLFLKAE